MTRIFLGMVLGFILGEIIKMQFELEEISVKLADNKGDDNG